MIVVSSHTILEEIIPEEPRILDVGARSFNWTKAMLKLRPKARIVALEPDPSVKNPNIQNVMFLNAALIHDNRTSSGYAGWSTGEGNILCDVRPHYAETFDDVICMNLEKLKNFTGIEYYDVIKLDCEGCEFGILENFPEGIAGQITVEFHDSDRQQLYPETYYDKLFHKLGEFVALKHGLTPIGPGPSYGHWDTLLVKETLLQPEMYE